MCDTYVKKPARVITESTPSGMDTRLKEKYVSNPEQLRSPRKVFELSNYSVLENIGACPVVFKDV